MCVCVCVCARAREFANVFELSHGTKVVSSVHLPTPFPCFLSSRSACSSGSYAPTTGSPSCICEEIDGGLQKKTIFVAQIFMPEKYVSLAFRNSAQATCKTAMLAITSQSGRTSLCLLGTLSFHPPHRPHRLTPSLHRFSANISRVLSIILSLYVL